MLSWPASAATAAMWFPAGPTREALVAFLQGGHTAVQPAKVTRMCIAGANDDCRVAMQGGWPAAPSLLASDLR